MARPKLAFAVNMDVIGDRRFLGFSLQEREAFESAVVAARTATAGPRERRLRNARLDETLVATRGMGENTEWLL